MKLAAAAAVLWLAAAGATEDATTTVAAKRLLDVGSGRILEDRVVEVRSGAIAAVRERRAGEAITYDLGDATILPGLVDCHVHLAGGVGLTPDGRLKETAARAAIEAVANARATLAAGFTTVRDLGSRDFVDVALRDAIAAGRVEGPRILCAVKSLSSTGGHGDRNDLPFDVRVDRYDAIADGPDEIRRRVRENVKYGADWIKILVTGGVMSAGTDPRRADYSEDEILAAVEAARERGRDVAAHAHGTEGIVRAALAGVRSIEHASMLDDAAVALLRERGTFIVPNPITNAVMLERGAAGGFEPFQLEKAREVYATKLESLRLAIRGGVRIAYGTDSGVQPHGENAKQLATYVEAGMTPLEAIRSATTVAAELLRLESTIGRVEPGYAADLIAVPGNPLADIHACERPVFVMRAGNWVRPNFPR